jgi:DNA-binding GntR family transcriptional regulator
MSHIPMSARDAETPAEGERPATLHDEVLVRLRNYIIEGNLPEGARIPEAELCGRFGVSRTPLREALKVLAAEGIVDLLPNRGARVRAVSLAEARDLLEFLGGLEALAGRLACERISEAGIAEIETLHFRMYRHYVQRELPDYFRNNQAIHQKIVEAAGNDALRAAHRSASAKVQRIRYAANTDPSRDRWAEAMREHEIILDALKRRAGGDLAQILFDHLRNKLALAGTPDYEFKNPLH